MVTVAHKGLPNTIPNNKQLSHNNEPDFVVWGEVPSQEGIAFGAGKGHSQATQAAVELGRVDLAAEVRVEQLEGFDRARLTTSNGLVKQHLQPEEVVAGVFAVVARY